MLKLTAKGKRISRKQSARWQHLSQLKARGLFFLQKNVSCMKHNNLYSGLVTPSRGWWGLLSKFIHTAFVVTNGEKMGMHTLLKIVIFMIKNIHKIGPIFLEWIVDKLLIGVLVDWALQLVLQMLQLLLQLLKLLLQLL